MDEENIPRDLASEEGDKPITSLEPPDGGLNAWLTVLGASLVASATFGCAFRRKSCSTRAPSRESETVPMMH
jgi:hypothetical protein